MIVGPWDFGGAETCEAPARAPFLSLGRMSLVDPYRRNSEPALHRGGVVILSLGFILLLDQIGILDASRIFTFWPLALIFFGYYRFTHASLEPGRFWGGFVFLLGLALQAEELGYGHVRFDTIWPVLLICAGVLLILKRYEPRSYWENPPPGAPGPPIDVPPGAPPPPPAPPIGAAPGASWPPGPSPNVLAGRDAASGRRTPASRQHRRRQCLSPEGRGSSFPFGGTPPSQTNFAGDPSNQRWPHHNRPGSEFENNMRDFGRKMDEFGERMHRKVAKSRSGNYFGNRIASIERGKYFLGRQAAHHLEEFFRRRDRRHFRRLRNRPHGKAICSVTRLKSKW